MKFTMDTQSTETKLGTFYFYCPQAGKKNAESLEQAVNKGGFLSDLHWLYYEEGQ
jgi:hypothetical protein